MALDVDEVIFPFVDEFSGWHNQVYQTTLHREDFHTYEFEEVLGISVPDVVSRLHQFLGQDNGHENITPIEQASDAIHKLGSTYSLVAVTARYPSFGKITRDYLQFHFGDVIEDTILIGHAANMDVLRTKAEVCLELGAIALVDDSIEHVSKCVDSGVGGVLFGYYPWNRGKILNPKIVRCDNWQAVLDYLDV